MKAKVCKLFYLIAEAAVAFLIFSLAVHAEAQEIKAELKPTTFGVEQTATLQIKIDGVQDAKIKLPDVEGLIFHQGGKSSNIQIINGAVTSSVTYSFGVQAQDPGSYKIPPITVVIDGKSQRTEPIECTVVKSSAQPTSPHQDRQVSDQPGSLAFIKFIPEKERSYLGEVVPVQIKAYFRKGTRINQISLPRFQGEGLLLDELSSNPPQTEESVDNVPYSVLVWDTYMTGVKEGSHRLGFELDATLLVPDRTRSNFPGFGSNVFGDDLFNDFFTSYSSKPIKASSSEFVVQVLPLPESAKPEGFTGAVGNFMLKLEARPTEVEIGEPITLAMTVEGSGNFNHVEAPAISDPGTMKLYTPSGVFTSSDSPYQGSKHFEQAAVITDPGTKQIPPVVFSFFNPDTARYQTIFSDPVDIVIKSAPVRTSVQPLPPDLTKTAPEETVSDGGTAMISLVPIKLETGRLVKQIRPPFLATWFLIVTSACLLLITGLFGYRIYGAFQAGHPEIRQRKETAALKKRTAALIDRLDPDDPAYLHRVRTAVEQLILKMRDKENGSLTAGDIVRDFGSESPVADLFRLDDQSRYSRSDGSPSDLVRLDKDIKSFIRELR